MAFGRPIYVSALKRFAQYKCLGFSFPARQPIALANRHSCPTQHVDPTEATLFRTTHWSKVNRTTPDKEQWACPLFWRILNQIGISSNSVLGGIPAAPYPLGQSRTMGIVFRGLNRDNRAFLPGGHIMLPRMAKKPPKKDN